jgi:hypothetical protein
MPTEHKGRFVYKGRLVKVGIWIRKLYIGTVNSASKGK